MSLVPTVPQYILYFVLFLHRSGGFRVRNGTRFVVKLLEVLHIVHVVGDLHSSARDAKFIARVSCPLLFLRPRAIVGIRIGIGDGLSRNGCAREGLNKSGGWSDDETYLWAWRVLSSSLVASSSARHTPRLHTRHLRRRRSHPQGRLRTPGNCGYEQRKARKYQTRVPTRPHPSPAMIPVNVNTLDDTTRKHNHVQRA